jgi:hypothetical protein
MWQIPVARPCLLHLVLEALFLLLHLHFQYPHSKVQLLNCLPYLRLLLHFPPVPDLSLGCLVLPWQGSLRYYQ